MYTDHLHGIDESELDLVSKQLIIPNELDRRNIEIGQTLKRGTRISLTIRHVPKTLAKFKLKF